MLVPRRSNHWQQYGMGMHYTSTTLHQYGTRRWPLHYASSVMVCNHSSGPRTIRHFSSPLSASARFCTVTRCSTLCQTSISRLQRAVQCVLTRTGFLTDAIHHRPSPPLKWGSGVVKPSFVSMSIKLCTNQSIAPAEGGRKWRVRTNENNVRTMCRKIICSQRWKYLASAVKC